MWEKIRRRFDLPHPTPYFNPTPYIPHPQPRQLDDSAPAMAIRSAPMSKLLILNEHEVHELLTMGECIAVMEEALARWRVARCTTRCAASSAPPGRPGFSD